MTSLPLAAERGRPSSKSPTPSSFPVAERVFCFNVQADTHPGLMPRVLEQFAKRNLVPSKWHSTVGGPGRDELAIDVQVAGLEPRVADHIARCLRQVPGVFLVLTSERRTA